MTLEQLMAFTVTNDHARQEQVWEVSRSGYNKEPYRSGGMLTESAVRASDRRAQFVGLEAYERAGGVVMRDLFEHDDGGWLQDPALLDRLVTEKLKAEAETMRPRAGSGSPSRPISPMATPPACASLRAEPADLTDEERATRSAQRENDRLEAGYQDADELPDEVDQRLGEIEAARSVLKIDPSIYDPAEIARAGVFVSIDPKACCRSSAATSGRRMRPRRRRTRRATKATDRTDTGHGQRRRCNAPSSPSAARRSKPSRTRRMTRQAAAGSARHRADRASNAGTARRAGKQSGSRLAGGAAQLCLATFYRLGSSGACLEIASGRPTFPAQAPGLKDSVSPSDRRRHEDGKPACPRTKPTCGTGSRRSTRDSRPRCLRIARHPRQRAPEPANR